MSHPVEKPASARANEIHALDSGTGRRASLLGASLTMFLVFVGFSSNQFHAYLFESRGVPALQIGMLIMAAQGAGILSPLFQVAIIRRFHGPRMPLMILLAGAALALAVMPHLRGFWPLLAAYALFSFCGAGIFPLNAACTFEALREVGHGAFFRIRSLGTLGFMAGYIISVFYPRLSDLPVLYGGFAACLLLGLLVVAWDYRRSAPARARMAGDSAARPMATFAHALKLLGRPDTLRLMIVLGVMNFANMLATGVQGNYLIDRWHEGQRAISLAWVISTACEVPLMLLCATVLRRYGLRYVLGFGIAGTLIKLVGLALAGEVWQFYLALAMHGCFFSGALTGFNVYLDRAYGKEERPALQALSPVFYGGIPSALAGLTAGLVWHAFSLHAVFLVSGAIAVLAAGYAFHLLLRNGQANGKPVF